MEVVVAQASRNAPDKNASVVLTAAATGLGVLDKFQVQQAEDEAEGDDDDDESISNAERNQKQAQHKQHNEQQRET